MTTPAVDVEFDNDNDELRLEAQMLESLPSGGLFDFDKFVQLTSPEQQHLQAEVAETQPSEPQQEAPSLSFTQRVLGGRFSKRATTTNDLRMMSHTTDSHTHLGRNSLGNATMVNTPTPPDEQLYSQDDFLGDLHFDLDNNSLVFADSTTLASEGRPSYDMSSDAGFRESTEYFDSLRPTDVPLPMKQRITNSINSMFKINSSNANSANGTTNNTNANATSTSRFNLRSMNPLSHKEDTAHLQHLSNLAEDSQNTYLDLDGDTRKKTEKEQPPKKKRIFFNGARIPFMKSQAQASNDDDVTQDAFMNFDYNDELSRVISMASLNSSSYNFNDAMRLSTDARPSMDAVSLSLQQAREQLDLTSLKQEEVGDAFANISLDHDNDNFIDDLNFGNDEGSGSALTAIGEQADDDDEEEEEAEEETENLSPDYAALFSDVKSKKRSKTSLPFRKKNTTTASLVKIEVSDADADVAETILPPLPEGVSLPTAPPVDEPPRRGRKPTLEYDASKQFVCSYCLRRFRRQEHLKRHFRSLHTNEKPFDCNLCGKKFSRNDNLAQHIKTHAEEGDIVEE